MYYLVLPHDIVIKINSLDNTQNYNKLCIYIENNELTSLFNLNKSDKTEEDK